MNGTYSQARSDHRETPLQRAVRWACWLAAWAVIVLAVRQLVVFAAAPDRLRALYGPFEVRVVGATVLLAGGQFFLWWRFFRLGGKEARAAAGLWGAWLAVLVLVQLLRQSIDVEINTQHTLILAGASLAHVAYATLGSRYTR